MIWRSREPRYDVASGISQGARDYQEDAITADFPVGAEAGFVVLADGMGGHAAGDVASKIVLTEVYSELKFHYADVEAFERRAPEILRSVADFANQTLREHTLSHPETEGMGATLVVPALVENRLWWISIGDSPLFLYRNGHLSQLNEDHSMAPQIDFMVQSGLLDASLGANHPDRNCLVSVLMGSKISKIDCPTEPVTLKAGDIVICSSDGLQFLSNAQIVKILAKYRKARSTEIAERLLEEIYKLNDPDQDNISFTIIKVNDASVRPKVPNAVRSPVSVARPRGVTKVVTEPVLVPVLTEVPSPAPRREEAATLVSLPVIAEAASVASLAAVEASATVVSLPVAEDAATVVSLPAVEEAATVVTLPGVEAVETVAAPPEAAPEVEDLTPVKVVTPRRFAALA